MTGGLLVFVGIGVLYCLRLIMFRLRIRRWRKRILGQ